MPQTRLRRYLRHGTLPQLAVFEASARLLSFTRAAAELHLAQPTVSAQIRKLSETLGTPLFEQVGKQIQLTPSGRCAYAHCLEVLAAIGRLDESLAGLRDVAAGELRLAIAGAATRFVSRIATAFAHRYPGITIRLRVDNRAGLLARLAAREDDLYLFAHPPQDVAVVRQSIVTNPLVIVAHQGDALARERAIPLSRIAATPFVMREPGSGTRSSVVDLFARAGLAPAVRMELASDEAIRCAVSEGAGIAALPRDSFGTEHALTVLDVAGFPIERHWHFVYAVGAQVGSAAEAFLRHVRDEACGPVRVQGSGAQNAVGYGSGP